MTYPCKYFQNQECSICTHINTAYNEQILFKEQTLINTLGLNQIDLIVPSSPFAFRDKAKFQISGDYLHPIIGFLDAEKLLVQNEIPHCPLHNHFINDQFDAIKNVIRKYKIIPYDIHKRTGELKGIILFYSPTSKESYLRFILRSKESIDRLKKSIDDLPGFNSISANIQPTPHAVLEGEEEIYFKNDSIIHQFNNNKLIISPQGFVQTNTLVAEKLYATAAKWVSSLNIERSIDVYCGHGPFSFHLEPVVKMNLGIEINANSIAKAKISKSQFGYTSEFKALPASSMSKDLIQYRPDLIVVNPPRAGLKDFVDTIGLSNSKYVLYSSCNLKTLNIDLEKLNLKYKINKVALFDMFPQSEHFETLVLLQAL